MYKRDNGIEMGLMLRALRLLPCEINLARPKLSEVRTMRRKHRPWSRRWEYDASSDRYQLHDEQLANLRIGRDMNAQAARVRRQTIRRHMVKGRDAATIALLTGIPRGTVYRYMAALRDPLLA